MPIKANWSICPLTRISRRKATPLSRIVWQRRFEFDSRRAQTSADASKITVDLPRREWMFGPCHEKDGVHFVDLTMLLKDAEETIYEDDCCHQRGNDLIAAKLAEAITVPYKRR